MSSVEKPIRYDAKKNEEHFGRIVVKEGDRERGENLASIFRVIADYYESARDDATPEDIHERRRQTYERLEAIRLRFPEVRDVVSALDIAMRPWTET